jgi:hypothetical protein
MIDKNIEAIEVALNECSSSIDRIESDDSLFSMEGAFNALFTISLLKKQLSEIETRVNDMTVAWMRQNGEKAHSFGTHILERKVSSRRKNWQHQTLLEAVINTSLSDESGQVVNPNTGEVIDVLSIAKPLIDAVVNNLTATAAIRDWRVTALRNIVPGLDPDDFCEVEKSERVSIIRK